MTMSKLERVKKWLRTTELIVFDAFAIMLSYAMIIAVFVILGISFDTRTFAIVLPIIIAVKLTVYLFTRLYDVLLDHFSFEDTVKLFSVVILMNIVLMVVFLFISVNFMHWMVLIFITPIELGFMLFPRVAKRGLKYLKLVLRRRGSAGVPTLIIGAGDGGELVLKELNRNKALKNMPLAFVDDDPQKYGHRLSGVPIIGPVSEIKTWIERYEIEEVIIAIANLDLKKLKELIDMISTMNVRIKRLPLLTEVTEDYSGNIIDVKVEDLLNRDEITLEIDEIQQLLSQKTVLITGGGGSIGSELARQIAKLAPKTLIIYDIYENNAYDIQMELERSFRKTDYEVELKVYVGSVYNEARFEKLFKTYSIDLIFHAAAYKHVPLLEDSPEEAIRSNVLGTYITAYLADKYNVASFVLVSSDKAVRPTNIMGATKRYAELIIQDFNHRSKTKYSAVRFGNVLGSNGSVVPLFKKQIQEGGPVTVTHPEITRYFMTIPEAVGLILQSAVYANGGEIFVLDMGEPVKITALAEKMIRLAGLKPKLDIDIVFTGLRPGEKIYEELLIDTTCNDRTKNQKIFIETDRCNGKVHFDALRFKDLAEKFEMYTADELKMVFKEMIDSYQYAKK